MPHLNSGMRKMKSRGERADVSPGVLHLVMDVTRDSITEERVEIARKGDAAGACKE